MRRAEGTFWHCGNRDCRKTVAYDDSERELKTRVCECGGLMKREATVTVFSYLNFLREEAVTETDRTKE